MIRKLKRFIAKQNMEKAGLKKFCKHSYTTNFYNGKPVGTNRINSKFASEWRNYIKEKE